MSFIKLVYVCVLFISSWGVGQKAYAQACDQHCLEQLLARIHTLGEQVKRTIPIGTILPYSGGMALPAGYLPCDGRVLTQNEYPELYETIGSTFNPSNPGGGSARRGAAVQFHLPDLRGRVPMGSREGDNPRNPGQVLGREKQTLQVNQLPVFTPVVVDPGHSHTLTDPGHAHCAFNGAGFVLHRPGVAPDKISSNYPPVGFFNMHHAQGHLLAASNVSEVAHTGMSLATSHSNISIQTIGGGRSFKIVQPSLVVRYMIKARYE